MIDRKKIEAIIIKNDIVSPEKGGKIKIVNAEQLSKIIYNLIKNEEK